MVDPHKLPRQANHPIPPEAHVRFELLVAPTSWDASTESATRRSHVACHARAEVDAPSPRRSQRPGWSSPGSSGCRPLFGPSSPAAHHKHIKSSTDFIGQARPRPAFVQQNAAAPAAGGQAPIINHSSLIDPRNQFRLGAMLAARSHVAAFGPMAIV
jgi:hypothetical protein